MAVSPGPCPRWLGGPGGSPSLPTRLRTLASPSVKRGHPCRPAKPRDQDVRALRLPRRQHMWDAPEAMTHASTHGPPPAALSPGHTLHSRGGQVRTPHP